LKTTYSYWYRKELLFAFFIVIEDSNFQIRQPFYVIFFLTYTAPFANFYRLTLGDNVQYIWQFYRRDIYYEKEVFACAGTYTGA